MALQPGTRLGPYEITAPIGAGGMGEVYRARDARLRRNVAIKVLPASASAAPDALSRFEREARMAAALSHPNILAIHDTGQHDNTLFLVTELVEGRTLRDVLAEGALPPRKAVDCAIQIARGLAAAHDRGIIHRDLKPENIVLTPGGTIKILDFGLARPIAEAASEEVQDAPTVAARTGEGLVLGTVGYLAPEQARGLRTIDQRADIFSFGCVLYELLTGRRAFQRETAAETLTAIIRDDPRPLDTGAIPPALERIVRRCLEKDPAERFQSARDLGFALEAISGASTSLIPAGELSSGSRVSRRLRAAAAVALAALLVLAGAGIGYRLTRAASAAHPVFKRLSFDRGTIRTARFAPDGVTVVYSAAWRGEPLRTFVTRVDSAESTPLNLPPGQVLCFSPAGDMLLLLNPTFHQWTTEGTLGRVPLLASNPRQLAEHVRDAVWVPGKEEVALVRRVDNRDRLEFPLGRTVYETTGYISHPRVSPDGTRIAFLDHPVFADNRGFVAVVQSGKAARRLSPEMAELSGLAWSPDGREIWFSGSQSAVHASLQAVPADAAGPTAPREIFQAPLDLHLLDVDANGRALVGAAERTSVVQGRAPGNAGDRDLNWLTWSSVAALSRDGKLLVGTNFDNPSLDYDVFVRPTDGSAGLLLGHGFAQDISPDGKLVLTLLLSQPPRLEIVPVGAGATVRLDVGGVEPRLARFFPDGRSVLVAGRTPAGAHRWLRVRLDANRVEPLAADGVADELREVFGLSPDGTEVLCGDGQRGLFALPIDGGARRVIGRLGEDEQAVGWGADANHVVVAQWDGARGVISSFAADSGVRERLLEIPTPEAAGRLQPPALVLARVGNAYAYAYSFTRMLGSVYLAEGLK